MAAGLSSSAAVELATALCLLQLAERTLPKNELVSLCRKAENEWVGLPCGILDQGTSAFGEANQVVRIDCAEEAYSTLPLPEGTAFWIFDTGIKHDLVDSHYGTRNRECMDALAALQTLDPKLLHLAHCPGDLLEKAELPENQMKRARHVIGEQARVEQCSKRASESRIRRRNLVRFFGNPMGVHPNSSKTASPNSITWSTCSTRMTKCWAPV